MSSRNVAIRKDVYDALHKEKRPQESFTRLFLRLLNQKAPLDQAVGAWGSLDRRRANRLLHQLRGTPARKGE
ncbi:MAG: antitoxin VapB family protein [Thermoplasmata archaeon]|nr:antitoxin VapB family protein [Thermoplasmata archaeon]